LRAGRTYASEGTHLEPFMDRFSTRAGRGGQLAGQLERAVVAVDVDNHPAGDQILGFRERAVGDRRRPFAVVADEGALRRERLIVDVLTGFFEMSGEIPH